MADSVFRRAERIANVEIPEIVLMAEAGRARRADGHPVISLGIGEPDFNTPDHVGEAAINAIREHDSHYPPIAGKPELRDAVAGLYDARIRDNVIISTGAKYAILTAFHASLDPGDEVVVPTPFWTSYGDIIRLCGGIVVELPTRAGEGFIPSEAALRAAMTEKTRWLLVNFPGNPSGGVIDAAGWDAIGRVLDDFPDCWLMSDEIYQHLTYGVDFVSAHDALPRHRDRTLIVNGASKSYAMTGWRLGFGVGPAELVRAMTTVQAQGTSGTSTISQAAALAAITGPQDLLEERRREFQERRDLVLEQLRGMPGIECPTPLGAFYVFPSWQGLKGGVTPEGVKLESDRDFCAYILEAADVVVIPGSAFSCPEHFRISYASSKDDLNEALGRMAKAIAAIKQA